MTGSDSLTNINTHKFNDTEHSYFLEKIKKQQMQIRLLQDELKA